MDGSDFGNNCSGTSDTVENPVKKRLRAKTVREKRAARKPPPHYKCVVCNRKNSNPEKLCLPVRM